MSGDENEEEPSPPKFVICVRHCCRYMLAAACPLECWIPPRSALGAALHCPRARSTSTAGWLLLTLGTKYREPNTKPKLPKIEPKLSKPKYSVPCSVPSF